MHSADNASSAQLERLMAVKRRKRLRHYNNPGDAHELTFSCHQRLPLLTRDRTRLWLIEAIEKARRNLAFDVWAYVIMPEHAHLLVWPRRTIYDTSRILSAIKRPVAIKAIRYLREHSAAWLQRLAVCSRDGESRYRFWMPGGGYDRNVIEPSTAHEMVEYIHLNPVRRGLVTRAEDWKWSSAAWYARVWPALLELDPTLPRASYP